MSTLLDAVGAFLEVDGAAASIVVVGGAALALHGWVPRTTQDVDVIALADEAGQLSPPDLPETLVRAVRRVARDFNLSDDWLNAQVGMQWRTGLPDALGESVRWQQFRALRVGLAGRSALIALKLFATADKGPRSVHLQDLLALRPTDSELEVASKWVEGQDLAPEWPQIVGDVARHVRHRRDHP